MNPSKIKNIINLWGRSKTAVPVSSIRGGGSKKYLEKLVNESAWDEDRQRRALANARKSPFAQELYMEMVQNGGNPEMTAMLSRDLTEGNLGSEEIVPAPQGYVFKANADACPRCLMFDGTWVANPIDAQLLSHPGCRCSVVPRGEYVDYEKDFGISTEDAAQNNKSFGHSEELTPWQLLRNDKSYWGEIGE